LVNRLLTASVLALPTVWTAVGCRSPYYADRGALFGGLTGAGVGAIVGDAVGNTGAGAAIGAGVGALTGAAVGDAMDEMEARTRAQIAQQLGRPVGAGAVSISDVVAMSQAGVDERLIVSHIRNSGVAAPLAASDVIYLHQQGVKPSVIEAMQSPPPVQPASTSAPVIVEQHHYAPPPPYYWRPYPYRYRHCHPHASWGFSVWH
jgi:hypothetical protein